MGRTTSEVDTKRAKIRRNQIEESREAGKRIEKEGTTIVYLCYNRVHISGKSPCRNDDLEEISVVNYY